MNRRFKLCNITIMALGLMLILASTYRQEVQITSNYYVVDVKPMSESSIKCLLDPSTVYLRISCNMTCDTRVLLRVEGRSLGLNCTRNAGLLDVGTIYQGRALAIMVVENYGDTDRTVNISLSEIGSIYPYRDLSVVGYFLWIIGFISILIFVFHKNLEKFLNRHKINK